MRLTLLSAFLFLSYISIAQEVNEIKIQSEIKDVTVFLTGGEVHRTASVKLKKGRNKLVFTRISTVADHKSTQFNADKKVQPGICQCRGGLSDIYRK
jgi:hypothetical protein